MQEVVERASRERGLAVDRWQFTAAEVAPYYDDVGEQTRDTDRPNVAGVRQGAGGGRSILLNAHVDTVENGDPHAWSRDPLGGEIVGDRLYGRGSCDMKGGWSRTWSRSTRWPRSASGCAAMSRSRRPSARRTAGSARSRPSCAATAPTLR